MVVAGRRAEAGPEAAVRAAAVAEGLPVEAEGVAEAEGEEAAEAEVVAEEEGAVVEAVAPTACSSAL